jgi:ribose transport system substrate-binding protein
VVGNWDDGTTQKAVADAIAVNGHFDGLYAQGGTTGACRALMNANHPFIPVAGEAENGFRKLIALHASEGLKGLSVGQSPALSAMSLKVALAALQGETLPQYVSAPMPSASYQDLKPGVNYFPDMSDDFFAGNSFPACNIIIDPVKLMSQSEANQ